MKSRAHIRSFIVFYLLVFAGFLIATVAGSKAITVMAESARKTDRRCIIIDAGHGGEDGGAVSCTGVFESNINLEIALRLDDLLHFLGYDTAMIRTTDVSIYTKGETLAQKKVSDLKERVRIANETDRAIYVSIHQNHFTDSRYHGAQVFYSDSSESKILAERIQQNFIRALNPLSNRQCKKASGVYLMEHIDCPGVLIECGFLSNPGEESKLRSAQYQQQICCVIASGLSMHLDS